MILLLLGLVTFPLFAGYLSMTVGAAWEGESRSYGVPFSLYSAAYYGDHREQVERLQCSTDIKDVHGPVEPWRLPLTKHPLQCLDPYDPPVWINWCPTAVRALFGLCTSVAYSDQTLQLPGFVDGLRRFLADPCAIDETAAAEIHRMALAPKNVPARYSKNTLCLSPRIVIVYFIDAEGRVRRTLWHFP